MTQRTQYHDATGREFLARARAYLAEDDLLQASEKGWGAAAQMVKAAAEARGWRTTATATSTGRSTGWRRKQMIRSSCACSTRPAHYT